MSEPTKRDMIRVQGHKEYLPVPARVQWFRGDHPTWTIDTAMLTLDWDTGYVVMRAEIRDDSDRVIGAGTKTETRKGFADFVEKAETGAVGRALARAGYGTEDALDLEGDRFADAPVEQPQGGERAPATRRAGPSTPATTHPAAPTRTPEEQALLDELLAIPMMTTARMSLLADAVGIPKGEHATADQLRRMLEIAHTPPPAPIEQPQHSKATDAPMSEAPGAAVQGDGEVARTSSSPSTSPSGAVTPAAATPADSDSVVPPAASESAASPTDEEILAVTGGEIVPPKPGTDEYKALPAQEKAAARAYHSKPPEPIQETLNEALGTPLVE